MFLYCVVQQGCQGVTSFGLLTWENVLLCFYLFMGLEVVFDYGWYSALIYSRCLGRGGWLGCLCLVGCIALRFQVLCARGVCVHCGDFGLWFVLGVLCLVVCFWLA